MPWPSQRSLWKSDQHDHKQAELNQRDPTDRDERRDRSLQQTQQYSRQQRPERLAQSCQHRHHEALQLINPTGKDGERKQSRNQCARGRRQRDADGEGERQNRGRGDAHQLRRLAIIGYRPNRLPGRVRYRNNSSANAMITAADGCRDVVAR